MKSLPGDGAAGRVQRIQPGSPLDCGPPKSQEPRPRTRPHAALRQVPAAAAIVPPAISWEPPSGKCRIDYAGVRYGPGSRLAGRCDTMSPSARATSARCDKPRRDEHGLELRHCGSSRSKPRRRLAPGTADDRREPPRATQGPCVPRLERPAPPHGLRSAAAPDRLPPLPTRAVLACLRARTRTAACILDALCGVPRRVGTSVGSERCERLASATGRPQSLVSVRSLGADLGRGCVGRPSA